MGYTPDEEEYPYPSGRPWSFLSFEDQVAGVTRFARAQTRKCEETAQLSDEDDWWTDFSRSTLINNYYTKYLPQYNELIARTKTQPLKDWLDSDKKCFQQREDLKAMEYLETAHDDYGELVDDLKEKSYRQALNGATQATKDNTKQRNLLKASAKNSTKEETDKFDKSMHKASDRYHALKMMNNGKLFTENPEPTYMSIDASKFTETHNEWKGVEEDTRKLIDLLEANGWREDLTKHTEVERR